MFNWENKIRFHYNRDHELQIEYHCGKCNAYLNITSLVYALLNYNQDDCPTELYQAWKVLHLGTSEYADNKGQPELEHDILASATKTQLIDIMLTMNKWQDEWPTEPGTYWFYGWCFTKSPFRETEKPGMYLVNVWGTATKGQYAYVTDGHFLYRQEAEGMWLKAILPTPPEEIKAR